MTVNAKFTLIFCSLSQVRRVNYAFRQQTRRGGTPYTGPYGEAPPERVTFFWLQVYERAGILLVYESI